MTEAEKERILGRGLNRQVYNQIEVYGEASRFDLRRYFAKYGEKQVKEALKELLFYGFIAENDSKNRYIVQLDFGRE